MTDPYDNIPAAAEANLQLTQADIEAILEDYRHRQMLEHLTGPIVSLVLHVIVLTLAFIFIGSPPTGTAREIEVTIEELKIKPLDQKVLEKITTERPDEAVPAVARPDVPADVVAEASVSEDFSDNVASTDDNTDVEAVLDIKANATPLRLSGLYGGRSSEGRKRMLASGGGSMITESAVLRALRWLKAHQNDDGSWSASQPVAMCGLALLTYLSHGETPESAEFGLTVQKAMKYLADKAITGNQMGDYAHGIGAYALAESYGMTKIPLVKAAAERAIQIIIDRQCAHGGWYYGLAKGEKWDLSVAGWQIQALKAAYIGGLENPGLLEAIEKTIKFLKKETYASGRFGYQSPGAGSPGMTGAGTLCLQLLGEGKSAEAQAGAKWISENVTVDWKGNTGFASYGWYYQTQAMFHAGTGFWKKWNDVFSKELVRNQKSDGHWESADGKGRGEYDDVLQTCFCCLMLQVYYRYLPTYKMPKAAAATSSALDLNDTGKDTDGLRIE